MIKIILLLLVSSIIHSQPLEFAFHGYINHFYVPADTNWREYRIPYNLLDIDIGVWVTEAILAINEGSSILYADSSEWLIDNIHFPSNAWETFEDSASYSIQPINSTQVWDSLSANTPDYSNHSLNFGYQRDGQTNISFYVTIEAPDSLYPTIPDTVGLWLKAKYLSNLWNYIPLQIRNTWKWDVITDLVDAHLWSIERVYNVISQDSIAQFQSYKWSESNLSHNLNHMILEFQNYELHQDIQDRVFINNGYIDFDLLPYEWGTGFWLEDESFTRIFNAVTLVKRYGSTFIGGWDYAYGVGLTYYPDGVGPEMKLVGAMINNQELGTLNIDNTVIVSMWEYGNIFDRSFVKVIPPDSGWYHYSIPIWTFLPFQEDPDTTIDCDSIQISFEPEIFGAYDQYGRIVLDDIIITRGDSTVLLIDDFENGLNRWYGEYALNDSYVYLDLIDDTPHDSSYYSMLIDFGNWSHPNFMGWSSITLYFDQTFTFHSSDEISFWLKDKYYSLNTEHDHYIIPKEFTLYQNYPNPFNPTTTIQYELPQRSDVQITIYDLLGREVTTLVSQTQDAGYKSVQWNASQVSSGMYFYQIRAGNYLQTKKMVVLK